MPKHRQARWRSHAPNLSRPTPIREKKTMREAELIAFFMREFERTGIYDHTALLRAVRALASTKNTGDKV